MVSIHFQRPTPAETKLQPSSSLPSRLFLAIARRLNINLDEPLSISQPTSSFIRSPVPGTKQTVISDLQIVLELLDTF